MSARGPSAAQNRRGVAEARDIQLGDGRKGALSSLLSLVIQIPSWFGFLQFQNTVMLAQPPTTVYLHRIFNLVVLKSTPAFVGLVYFIAYGEGTIVGVLEELVNNEVNVIFTTEAVY